MCQHMMDDGIYGKGKVEVRDTEGRRGAMCVCVCTRVPCIRAFVPDCLSVYSVTLCPIPLRHSLSLNLGCMFSRLKWKPKSHSNCHVFVFHPRAGVAGIREYPA